MKLEPDPSLTGSTKTFREWLIENRYSTYQFAKEFGYSQQSIFGYASGRQVPRLKTAMHISKITNGTVKVEGWV